MHIWGKKLRIMLRWICMLGFLAALGSVSPAAPITREQVEIGIKKLAVDDAIAGQRNLEIALRLYAAEAKSIGIEEREIVAIYSDTYRNERERHPSSPWGDFFKIATILAIVATFLRARIDAMFSKVASLFWVSIYERHAGSRIMRRLALRKYRRRLVSKLEVLRLPFRTGRPLDMRSIYIPLRTKEAHAEGGRGRREDVFNALAKHRRLVVLGAPGAGKSMLLRHIALTCAEQRVPAPLDQPIPVLLELHRLTDPTATIEIEMTAELGRTGFPHAKSFVEQNLEKGAFLLLLDGFDEITATQRGRVAGQIRDLTEKYNEIRVAITCRTAVYKGALDLIADQKLELIDFNDYEIKHYLRTWTRYMPPGKRIEELINKLEKLPQIKRLAGNPLLLTIIAYLFADHPDVVLPHSRSQFYKTATDLLLQRWHDEHNRFALPPKRAILEHLALIHHTNTASDHPDPRVMKREMVIKEVQELCPSLNLNPADAESVLLEIVERSGLLSIVDSERHYCFAHNTLQEYFTAERLQHEPGRVLQFYETDPDRWREVLRLWCGLSSDSTRVITKLREFDRLMAFECLADAQMVSSDLAEGLVVEQKTILDMDGPDDDRTHMALGKVAADPRQRGIELFAFLVKTLDDNKKQAIAARALAETGLENAVTALGKRIQENNTIIRSALVSMGDLAVPELTRVLAEGQVWAVDDLHAIRTPRAAEALVPLLWHNAKDVSLPVAFALGELLKDRYVEAALRNAELPVALQVPGRFDWAWKPFSETDNSPLRFIVDRISSLVEDTPDNQLPLRRLDARVVIPVYIRQLSREPTFAKHRNISTGTRGTSSRLMALMSSMDAAMSQRLNEILRHARRAPTREDWISMFHPTRYDIVDGWHLRVYILICLSLCIPAFLQIALRFWNSASSLIDIVYYGLVALLLLGIIVIGTLRIALRGSDDGGKIRIFGYIAMIFYAPASIPKLLRGVWFTVYPHGIADRREIILETIRTVAVGSWVPFASYYSYQFLDNHLVYAGMMIWLSVVVMTCSVLFFLAQRKLNAVANPLFGLLDFRISTVFMHWLVGLRYRIPAGLLPSLNMPSDDYMIVDDEQPSYASDSPARTIVASADVTIGRVSGPNEKTLLSTAPRDS